MMFYIKIVRASGKVERRPLSRSQPVSVGRHPSSDVRINESGVQPLHCRIGLGKDSVEVAAATSEGVLVNGTVVRKWKLSPQDVIRVGDAEIRLRQKRQKPSAKQVAPAKQREQPAELPRKPARTRPAPPPDEDAISESLELLLEAEEEDVHFEGELVEQDAKAAPAPSAEVPVPVDVSADEVEDYEEPDEEPVSTRLPRLKAGEDQESEPSKLTVLRQKLRSRQVRPGEQDVLRSPIVLTLGGGAVVLLLLAAIFWFIIQRQVVQQQFDAAKTEYEQGHFTQAIALFEGFLDRYPRHKYAQEAAITLGRAQIEKEITGATPSWSNGLKALQEFIDKTRDQPYFADLHDSLIKYAKDIALGSLKTAAATKNRELLDVSSAAALIFDRYAPSDPPPVEVHQQLKSSRENAERVILKHETFQAALSDIDQALKDNKPLDALVHRRQLLARYPDLESDRRLVASLQNTLETARRTVVREELNRPAVTTELRASKTTPLTLAVHTRALGGQTSDGQTVFAVAKGCCYAIDRVTGVPVWRRVIGLDQPFFPMLVQNSHALGLLTYDSRTRELVLLDRESGQLIWRQALEEDAVGQPLVVEGQIYQVTEGNRLYKIELETGLASVRLTFAQRLHAPATLVSQGTHLILAGDEALLFTLSLRPLACQTVSLLGHEPGSLAAPLLPMGNLILVPENDSLDSCLLRVVDASEPDQTLHEIEDARAQINGQVHDRAIMRGNALFVPSTGEQLTAFTVSDDPNQHPLTLVGRHAVKTTHPGPVFLTAGPDGQTWMAGSALRRFQLKTNAISLDPNLVAEGLTTQPLQAYGQYLFLGRRRPHSTAVWFVKINREAQPTMTSLWRTIVGARILTATPSGPNTILCMTEEGYLFHVTSDECAKGGYRTRADSQLQLPESLAEPLRAALLTDGQIAIFSGAPEPRLWLLTSQGQVRREASLPGRLEAEPVELAGGLILPMAQKLEYQSFQTGRSRVEGYTAPVQNQADVPHWTGLVPLSDNELVAVNSNGSVIKVQYRTAPVTHLYEAAKMAMDAPVTIGPTVFEENVVVTDATGRLRVLHKSNFDPVAETQLEAPASGPLRVVDGRLLVEVGRAQLACFQIDRDLKELWTIPLDGSGLADQPVTWNEKLVIAERSGRVQILDPDSGNVVQQTTVEQPIDLGPRILGSRLFVASIDGTLYQLNLDEQTNQ